MKELLYKKGLVYSLDEGLGIKDLRTMKKFANYDFDQIEKRLRDNEVSFIVEGNLGYHYKLLSIKSKPYIVYYKGDLSILNKKIIGIVGPRKISEYGKEILDKLFARFCGFDLVTISGMADGVDKYCHNLSIKKSIPTIAVLGGGLGFYLLSKERRFIEKIVDNGGLVISEFKLKFNPTQYSFPQRNRLIAGLADFIFLPEAGEKSGSLITADFAKQMNIPVFGTPGSVFHEGSMGLNKYISQNKIEAVYDIEEFVGRKIGINIDVVIDKQDLSIDLTDHEQKVFTIVSRKGQASLNEIVTELAESIPKILVSMTSLEMKGLVYEKSPNVYVLRK